MRRLKSGVAVCLSLLFLITVIFPVYADNIQEQQQKLQNVGRQIDQQRSNVNQARQREKTVMGQIFGLDQDINKTESEINYTDDRIAYLKQNIEEVEGEIKVSEEALAEQSDTLGNRLVFIYEKGGDVSYLEVLLSAADIKDFLTRYDLLNMIVEQDVELIKAINKEKKELSLKKCDLEIKQKELVNIQANQMGQKEILDSQKEEKQKLLGSVRLEKKKQEQALNELERESRQLEAIIRQYQSGNTGSQAGTGTFTWPAPGYTNITSPYGMRLHPILNERRLHTGMDIRAPMGATIVAADSGTVIFAGWMSGYGQVIIVDHKNDLSTLYAHQSSFLVSKGANVSKGQAIGKVGSTGWSTGPHLHFEVRVKGTPTNPIGYVR
ncbi:MAG: peptidoglycan DD-metalloendopeptidase family protein [Syntrophomonadaceae bacterium]|nr:peptidoglycan DD-metalloendopeptidase family protein [Syntrophomonadaceae bacterium]